MLACGHPGAEPSPVIVAGPPAEAFRQVETLRRPPPELLACPVAPAGFPENREAVVPAEIRAAAFRLAVAYAQVADQLRRLIAWEDPDAPCAEVAP